MTIARDICEMLQASASSGHIAFQISDATFAKIIAALRRQFGITFLEAELLLPDAMREHEEALYAALHDQIRLDDAEDAVVRCLGDDL